MPEGNAGIAELSCWLFVPLRHMLILRMGLPHHVVFTIEIKRGGGIVFAKAAVADVIVGLHVEGKIRLRVLAPARIVVGVVFEQRPAERPTEVGRSCRGQYG